jgi:hypothetical protein
VAETPGRSAEGALPQASSIETALAERLRVHVETIASAERNVSRNPGQLDRAAAYIERELVAIGLDVEAQAYGADGHVVRNLSVEIGPIRSDPETATIVVGAHYDSFPGSPGANDNATGTAALIELARGLAELRGRTPVRLRLAFFTNEEPPYFHTDLMGSYRFAQMLAAKRERVIAMYSLETIGFFSNQPNSQRYPFPLGLMYPNRGDFVAFVSTTRSRRLMQEAISAFRQTTSFPSQGGAAPGFLPGVDWSDHWSFEQFDYPAIMITDTAVFRYPHYHTADDTPDKINYSKLARISRGVETLIRDKALSGR